MSRTVRTIFAGLGCLGAFVACSPADPCPIGSVALESQDRCMRISAVASDGSVDGMAGGPDARSPLADGAPETASEASTPADAMVNRDAAAGDSGITPVCSSADVQAWKTFHEQDGVVATLNQCSLMGCADASCRAKACVRSRAGVQTCESCPDDEGECVRVHCFYACGPSGDDRECRACECEAACIERFEACAQAELGLCDDTVYGRDLPSDRLTVAHPFILRLKPDNGSLQPVPIAEDLSLSKFLSTDHFSTGFGLLKSFTHEGRTYVIQHKNACAEVPCIARISPVSQDGILGKPVYVDSWTQGWDRLATFKLAEETYLLRYKSGTLPTQREARGHLRIERLRFDALKEQVTLEPVLDEQATLVFDGSWSLLETFAIDGKPYLVTYGSERDGELSFFELEASELGIKRKAVSNGLRWPRGLDVLNVFRKQNRWFLAAYASGRSDVTELQAGYTMIVEATTDLFSNGLGPTPLFEGNLAPALTHLAGFERGGKVGLFQLASSSGGASVFELPEDPSQWADQSWTLRDEGTWNTSPPWRVVTLIKPYTWNEP